MSLEGKVPRINWPEKYADYRVVQIEIEGERYLRFQEKGNRWSGEVHFEIITDLAEILGKRCKRGYNDVAYLPLLESDWYKVHGMGLARVNLEDRTASFHGESEEYKIGLDEEYLISMKEFAPGWKFLNDGKELS